MACTTLTVLAPAKISAQNISLNPTSAQPGDTVTATVTFYNSGDVQGTANFRVYTSQQTLTTGTVTVAAKSTATKSVTFTAPSSAGSYQICAEVTTVAWEFDKVAAPISEDEEKSLGILQVNGKTMVWL